MDMYDNFIDFLLEKGWVLEPVDGVCEDLISSARKAARVPADYIDFLRKFSSLASSDDTRWFLSLADFSGSSENAFSWDEFEKISADSAMSDVDKASVREFWDDFIPIALGVDGDYEFIALSRSTGVVVGGSEPEFENVNELAGSFSELIDGVLAGKINVPLLDS